uniref:Uncharacterized protein LOC114338477 n=1 Tax=Diabrotica virgifera virgifera TaxID=50390 RepID=A0A6P7G744_DIAVI
MSCDFAINTFVPFFWAIVHGVSLCSTPDASLQDLIFTLRPAVSVLHALVAPDDTDFLLNCAGCISHPNKAYPYKTRCNVFIDLNCGVEVSAICLTKGSPDLTRSVPSRKGLNRADNVSFFG